MTQQEQENINISSALQKPMIKKIKNGREISITQKRFQKIVKLLENEIGEWSFSDAYDVKGEIEGKVISFASFYAFVDNHPVKLYFKTVYKTDGHGNIDYNNELVSKTEYILRPSEYHPSKK